MQKSNISAIFKKELRSYFASPVGYVFIIFYLLVSNGFFFFISDFFRAGQASMRGYFATLPWIFLFFVPAISMRLWAEEKKNKGIYKEEKRKRKKNERKNLTDGSKR